MNNIKKVFKLRITLSPALSFILIAVLSLLITYFTLFIAPISFSVLFNISRQSSFLNLLLNSIPVFLSIIFLFFLTSDFVSSVSIASFVFITVSIVNRFKILYRNDPFMPWDLSLSGELLGIIKSFGVTFLLSIILAVILYVAVCVLARVFIKTKKLNIKLRVAGVMLTLIIMYIVNSVIYQNATINRNLFVYGNIYNQVNTFNSKGFIYSFIYVHNTNRLNKPNDYNAHRVLDEINRFEKADTQEFENIVKPHIFMIMGEAYSEMALIESFDFTGFTHPMENYKRIKEDSIYGQIIVPNIGGGTADTEFDVLTGLNTRHLRGIPFSYRLVNNDFEALPSILSQIGYRSVAIHPGHSWFYNRQNVFRYFGFDEKIFMDEFDEDDTKGMYISETATTEKILDVFKEHLIKSPDVPFFNFTITIQNHGPYRDKYLVDTNFNTDLDISADSVNAISNYFEGVIDADIQIKTLTDYFESINEPVVLVYFGDHLPAFSPDVYEALYPNIYENGSFEDLSRLYKTPFIIWQNTVAKNTTNINQNFEELIFPENNIISASLLGAYLFELLGYNSLSPFIDFVNKVRTEFPVMFESKSFSIDCVSSLDLSNEEKERLLIYRDWEFYKIFDK